MGPRKKASHSHYAYVRMLFLVFLLASNLASKLASIRVTHGRNSKEEWPSDPFRFVTPRASDVSVSGESRSCRPSCALKASGVSGVGGNQGKVTHVSVHFPIESGWSTGRSFALKMILEARKVICAEFKN